MSKKANGSYSVRSDRGCSDAARTWAAGAGTAPGIAGLDEENITGEGIMSIKSKTESEASSTEGTGSDTCALGGEGRVPPERIWADLDAGSVTGDGIIARKSNAGSDSTYVGCTGASASDLEERGMPPERMRADFGGILSSKM